MSNYNFDGETGCVIRITNPVNNQVGSVWCGVQSGWQTDVQMGRWVVACETHAKFRLSNSLKNAKLAIEKPETFCEACKVG